MTNTPGAQPSAKSVPPEIAERLSAWHRLWKQSAAYHYTLGILGVTCSAIAATEVKYVHQIAAVLAAVCLAVIAFVNPQRRYLKFVRAWRVLDAELDRYRYLDGTLESLIQAKQLGEDILTEVEQDQSTGRPKYVENE